MDGASVGPLVLVRFSTDETIDIGRAAGTQVSAQYKDRAEFDFESGLDKAVFKMN